MHGNFKQTSEANHLWFSYQAYLWQAPCKYSFQLGAPATPLWNTVLHVSERQSPTDAGNVGSHVYTPILPRRPHGLAG